MESQTQAVFPISVAAGLVQMEIQNLRVYEKRGLVAPQRTPGGTRLYSRDDLERLTEIRILLGDGLNLAGIATVLALRLEVRDLKSENQELQERLNTGVGGHVEPSKSSR